MERHEILSLARGSYQYYGILRLLDYNNWPHATRDIKGRAKNYTDLYTRSQARTVDRLRAAGIGVVFVPGPRGGKGGGHYEIQASRH